MKTEYRQEKKEVSKENKNYIQKKVVKKML